MPWQLSYFAALSNPKFQKRPNFFFKTAKRVECFVYKSLNLSPSGNSHNYESAATSWKHDLEQVQRSWFLVIDDLIQLCSYLLQVLFEDQAIKGTVVDCKIVLKNGQDIALPPSKKGKSFIIFENPWTPNEFVQETSDYCRNPKKFDWKTQTGKDLSIVQ